MTEAPFTIEGKTGTSGPNGARKTVIIASADQQEERLFYNLTSEPRSSNRVLSLDELYPLADGRVALIHRARSMLTTSIERIERARQSLEEDDNVGSDYEITLLQGEIPELFCCHELSEGFATVVVALHFALKNRKGAPLVNEQLANIQRTLSRLKKEIFLNYETALDLIDDLEAVELATDPPEADALNALLLDESDS